LGIENIRIKFSDDERRKLFLNALKKLAPLINLNFPNTYPIVGISNTETPDQLDAGDCWTGFWRGYFLPDIFDELVNDLIGTELKTLQTKTETISNASAYLAAFTVLFIRVDLDADEGMDQGTIESLTEALRNTQIQLVKFLRLLVAAMPAKDVHRVAILDENQIEVDGKISGIKSAALRALLSLALLRGNSEFNVEQFAKFYHGGDPVEARHDFDNAMKALKKHLPKLDWTSAEGIRTVRNLIMRVEVNNAEIEKRLKILR
jgi:hypothetical protein